MMNMGNKYIRLSYWKQYMSRNHSEKMENVKRRRHIIYLDHDVRTIETQSPIQASEGLNSK